MQEAPGCQVHPQSRPVLSLPSKTTLLAVIQVLRAVDLARGKPLPAGPQAHEEAVIDDDFQASVRLSGGSTTGFLPHEDPLRG